MTVTRNIPPDIEAGLLAQARAEGLEVSDYVGSRNASTGRTVDL